MARKEDQNDRTHVQVHDPLVGTVFDRRFHIDFRIAIGGFGAIYHATHKSSGHQFALKILHPRLASDAGVIARFQREGATLTRLRCPHTIIAYELGESDDGTLFIVMELLHGESLFERYRARGPFEWKEMARIARGVCASLEEAHKLGIIHRDLKPTNINLETVDGDASFAKVLDFGIAKILRESEMDSADLTNAGQMIGTLDYMSPEQMVGGTVTGHTDIYTLGIVMYEMIAGRRPFAEASSPAAVLAAMLRTTPTPLSGLKPVPKEMDKIVMRCLEREASARWDNVAQLGAALDRLLRGNTQDDRADITRTLPIEVGEESTVLEERRPSTTAPYAAQSNLAIGELPTEPAQVVARARQSAAEIAPPRTKAPSQAGPMPAARPSAAEVPRTKAPSQAGSMPPASTVPRVERASHPMLTTIPGHRAPPITTPPPILDNTPTPLTTRKPPDPQQQTPTPLTTRKAPTQPPPTSQPVFPGTPAPPPSASNRASQPLFGSPPGAVGMHSNQAAMAMPGAVGTRPDQAALAQGNQAGMTMPMHQQPPAHIATPLPGGLALFPPQPELPGTIRHKPPTAPPPSPVIQPPGPPVPLPHAPPRPVIDLASFAPQPGIPPTPAPGMPGFDMAQIAARDAAVRRIVWIVVIVAAAIIGVVLASQL